MKPVVKAVSYTHLVISYMAISEYDKRLVLLTKEFGKITAFARGARKTTSQFLAGSQPMAFGEFTLYRGRNAYTCLLYTSVPVFCGAGGPGVIVGTTGGYITGFIFTALIIGIITHFFEKSSTWLNIGATVVAMILGDVVCLSLIHI